MFLYLKNLKAISHDICPVTKPLKNYIYTIVVFLIQSQRHIYAALHFKMPQTDFSAGLACHRALLTYPLQWSVSDNFALHCQLEKNNNQNILPSKFLAAPMLKANDV